MAGANEVLMQMVQLLPVLGELGARVQQIEARMDAYELGAMQQSTTTAGDEGDGGEVDIPGVGKIGLADLFKRYMPAGGPAGLFSAAVSRGLGGAAPAAATPSVAPAAAAPAAPQREVT